ARLEAYWASLLVDALPASQVVHQQLDVGQVGPEVVVVRVLGRPAAPGLVVDHLARAFAGVVDAVDLPADLCAVEPEAELALYHEGAQPRDRLEARGEAEVVLKDAPALLPLGAAVEPRLDRVQVRLQVRLGGRLEPLALELCGEVAPFGLP